MTSNRPWYEDWEDQCDLAERYILAADQRYKFGKAVTDEIISYNIGTLYKVIYESNLIENAGLSKSDTKKLIDEIRRNKLDFSLEKNKVEYFEGKARKKKEVFQHYFALMTSTIEALGQKKSSLYGDLLEDTVFAKGKEKNIINRYIDLLTREQECYRFHYRYFSHKHLFIERSIKLYHRYMAEDLIEKNAGVRSGRYRIDQRTTDFKTSFVSWQNIPSAMRRFIRKSNEIMKSDMNPILEAARISYDFAGRIHPFPDFNGRMARLIMNMVLRYEGLPFFAVLKGNKKEKHRYITSLRHHDRGKTASYACLIARAVNRGFEELNQNLKAAGLDSIHPVPENKIRKRSNRK